MSLRADSLHDTAWFMEDASKGALVQDDDPLALPLATKWEPPEERTPDWDAIAERLAALKAGGGARGSGAAEVLCCEAMAWAEQMSVQACIESECPPPDNLPTEYPEPLGTILGAAGRMQGALHVAPHHGEEGAQRYAELAADPKMLYSFSSRFELARLLC